MAEQRIQKVLSDQGVCSRRAAEKLIDEGRVKVNGYPVTLGDKMDPDFDKVSIDGKSVRIVRKRQYTYLMLNKPRGYITTASDERGRKTVMDLLTGVDRRVYPIGRLDKDSEGLLLLTDDGAFANLLTHPSGGVGKLYRVTVRPRATEEQVVKMSSGVVLDDGVKTQPAVIHVVVDEPGRTVLEITLHEGRNRQIRRMCEAVGLEVIRLKRSAEGPVKLGMLQPGEYRAVAATQFTLPGWPVRYVVNGSDVDKTDSAYWTDGAQYATETVAADEIMYGAWTSGTQTPSEHSVTVVNKTCYDEADNSCTSVDYELNGDTLTFTVTTLKSAYTHLVQVQMGDGEAVTVKPDEKGTYTVTGVSDNVTILVTSVLKGDVIMDGKINNKDLIRVRQIVLSNYMPTELERLTADTFSDGKINNKDLIRVRQYILGNIQSF